MRIENQGPDTNVEPPSTRRAPRRKRRDGLLLLLCALLPLAFPAWAAASSGDAAFIGGTYTIAPNTAGTSAEISVAGILNTTTNVTSGSLGFELWYSTTPYDGGTITGYKVAVSYLPIGQCTSSTLAPGGECVSILVEDTLSLPPAGVYYPVLVLVEHTATCTDVTGYCIDDFVTLVRASDGGATVTVGSGSGGGGGGGGGATATSSVAIVGNYSYESDLAAGTVALDVAEILNGSATYTTGTLRLELWLTTSPYAGGSISGNRIATYQIAGSSNGTLAPNQYFSNIDVSVPLSDLPGPGTYDVTMIVSEYTNNCGTVDGYCIDTYGTFPNQFVVASTSDVSTPSGHSGGGALGALEIFGLGALLLIPRRRPSKRAQPIPSATRFDNLDEQQATYMLRSVQVEKPRKGS